MNKLNMCYILVNQAKLQRCEKILLVYTRKKFAQKYGSICISKQTGVVTFLGKKLANWMIMINKEEKRGSDLLAKKDCRRKEPINKSGLDDNNQFWIIQFQRNV